MSEPVWTFPEDAPPDPRKDLLAFVLTPNWKNGVLERVEFLTDIMSSEVAEEQRRSARRFPRRSFEVSFLRSDADRSYLDYFLAGIGKNRFLVPLWHEQYRMNTITEPNEFGEVQFPEGTLTDREFQVGDLVLITEGVKRWQVLTVTWIDIPNDMISLSVGEGEAIYVGAWAANTRITPLRVCRNMDPTQISNPADMVGLSTIKFSLSESDPRFLADFYRTDPDNGRWNFKPDRATEITNSYDRTDFVIDYQGGVTEVDDPAQRAQIGVSMSLTLFGRKKVYDFRAFIHAARGRAVSFMMPTYTRDFQIISAVDDQLYVQPTFFGQWMNPPQNARKTIVIKYKDPERGEWTADILGVSDNYDDDGRAVSTALSMSDNVPDDTTPDSVDKIYFLVRARFNQDSFEILHVTDDSKAVKAAVTMLSTDSYDGSPPV